MVTTKHLRYAEYITNFLDTKFSILGIRIGLDPFLDFIPILGPVIGSGMSAYLLWIGIKMNVSGWILLRMLLNIFIDYVIGNVPFIGFFGDWLFKANVRNLTLLKEQVTDGVLEGRVV